MNPDLSNTPRTFPDWDSLLDLAASQAGLFSTGQARGLGFSPELLIHHTRCGRLRRIRRGVYRVRHLPPSDDEQLVEIWLWSGQQATFSHRTAMALHDLSDVLPSRIDITVPASWQRRRLRVPEGVDIHPADLREEDRGWVGHVPVTLARRTVLDCVAIHLAPDLLHQAIDEGLRRGLFSSDEIQPTLLALQDQELGEKPL